MDQTLLHTVGAVCTASHPSCPISSARLTYEGVCDSNYTNAKSTVPIRKAHRFCFACGDTRHHWPVSCDHLSKWESVVKTQVKDVIQSETDEIDAEKADYSDVAQKLWLKTNTRPCPKVRELKYGLLDHSTSSPHTSRFFSILQCKAAIEKNEGCNHMVCSNPRCKHEFCWICRNDWSLHNTQTGGTPFRLHATSCAVHDYFVASSLSLGFTFLLISFCRFLQM
jgi:hypothetical protein